MTFPGFPGVENNGTSRRWKGFQAPL